MDIITNQLLRQAVPLFNAMAAVALALGIATLLMTGQAIIVPLALAILLSFALTPVVSWLERIGFGRGLAVVSAIVLALAVIVSMAYVSYRQMVTLAQDIPSYEATIRQKISGLSRQLAGQSVFSDAADSLTRVLTDIEKIAAADQPKPPPTIRIDSSLHGFNALQHYLQPVLYPLGSLLLIMVLAAFLLLEREELRNRLIRLAGVEDLQQTTAAMDDAGFRVGRQLLIQLSVNLSLALIIGTGLWLIGLPSPFLWGILYGLLNFVPYLGLIGLVPPLFVAFATDPSWTSFLWTAGLFAIVEPVSSNIIEPMLYGRTSGLSPVAIIIAASIWAFLWGPIGLVLSTPLTICLVAIGRHVPRLRFLEILLGDRPALKPAEIFYQRMLAGDPHEAGIQAGRFLKQRSLSTYYDEIALEAIRRAHLDIVRGSVAGERLTALAATTEALVNALGKLHKAPHPLGQERNRAAETEAALDEVRGDRAFEKVVLTHEELRPEWQGPMPVAILHGAHPLDGAVALMLQQVLIKHGLAAQVWPLTQAAEQTTPEQAQSVALVCLAFLEPLSTLHLRAFSRQVKRHAPQAQIMLCIWQKVEPPLLQEWRRKLRVDRLVTTTANALDAVLSMAAAKRSWDEG